MPRPVVQPGLIRGSTALGWRQSPDVERVEGVVYEWQVVSRSWSDRAGAEWAITPVESPGDPEWRFRSAGEALVYARAYDPQGRPRDGVPRLPGCEGC